MKEADPPILSVIIISYNTRQLTFDCLSSLQKRIGEANLSAEIFVVDNGSLDNSAAMVEAEFPEVILISNSQNVGFGTANNQAMRRARGRYFLLLNSDAFLHEGTLAAMIGFLDSNPDISVVGPRMLNEDGSEQVSIHLYRTPKMAWQQFLGLKGMFITENPASGFSSRYYLKGACLLLRREVYERVGGFDESFFLYGEDSDWQKRILEHGFASAFLKDATITHLEGKSGTKSSTNQLRWILCFFASTDWYMAKHFAGVGFWLYRIGIFFWCLRTLVSCFLVRSKNPRATFEQKLSRFLMSHIFSPSARLKEETLNMGSDSTIPTNENSATSG